MSPSTSRPVATERVDEAGRLAGAHPAFCGSSRGSPRRAPGRRARAGRSRRRASSRSTDCQHVDPRRERAHLVALELPDEVPARAGRSASSGALASSSWARFSPTSTTPAADDRPRRARRATVFVAATRRDVGRGRDRDARRGRRDPRPRPPATAARPTAAHVGLTRVAHHDHGLAAGRAVAPVREVVGRRRRCTRRRR